MGSNGDRKYLSFFSGALGLDLGFEAAGFAALSYNEYDPVICSTIRANRPSTPLYGCDARELKPRKLMLELGIEVGELFAIIGGPPCQAFSTAGRRLGLNDERGNVFLHFIDLIRELKPKYAVFENVRGLLSAPLVHRPHEQRGEGYAALTQDEKPGGALLRILQLLEEAGYTTTFNLYDMANYGVPQNRERLIFFASRDGRGIPFIAPTHSKSDSKLLPWRTVRDALRTVKAPGQYLQFPEHRLKYFAMLTEGQNWRDLPPKLQRQAMGKSWECGGGRTGFYRRLAWDKPSPTLVTRPTMPATALCHPDQLRPLSVREYLAIQTFPPRYELCGRLEQQYLQVGNAVPPLFAQRVARHVLDFDENRLADCGIEAKFSRYSGTDHDSWLDQVRPQLLF